MGTATGGKKTRRRGPDPIEVPPSTVNKYEIKEYHLDGKHTRTIFVACLACGGRSFDDKVEGGFLPFAWVDEKSGHVLRLRSFCNCEIGCYQAEIYERAGMHRYRYVDLPDTHRVPIHQMDDADLVWSFYWWKVAELSRARQEDHYDPDTSSFVKYSADGEASSFEVPSATSSTIKQVLEAISDKLGDRFGGSPIEDKPELQVVKPPAMEPEYTDDDGDLPF